MSESGRGGAKPQNTTSTRESEVGWMRTQNNFHETSKKDQQLKAGRQSATKNHQEAAECASNHNGCKSHTHTHTLVRTHTHTRTHRYAFSCTHWTFHSEGSVATAGADMEETIIMFCSSFGWRRDKLSGGNNCAAVLM